MKEINKTIEGYNVNGICVGCLNYNRKMFHLDEVNECFKTLGNIHVSDGVKIKVCWECLATIRNTMRFKEQIEESLNKLLKYSRMHISLNAPEDISQFATQRLGIHKTKNHSYPCLDDESKIPSVKTEPGEYFNDESVMHMKGDDRMSEDTNYQQKDLSPGGLSSSGVVKHLNVHNSHVHTFARKAEVASPCTTQRLNIHKAILPSQSNQGDENKMMNVFVKQEPEEIPIDFDISGTEIKVEDCGWEDRNNLQEDLSSDPMSSEDDVLLSKLSKQQKINLEDGQGKNIKNEMESKPRKNPNLCAATDHLERKCDCQQRFFSIMEKNTDYSRDGRNRKIYYSADYENKKREERLQKGRERSKRYRERKKRAALIDGGLTETEKEKRERKLRCDKEKSKRYREKKKKAIVAMLMDGAHSSSDFLRVSDSKMKKERQKLNSKRYRDRKRQRQACGLPTEVKTFFIGEHCDVTITRVP